MSTQPHVFTRFPLRSEPCECQYQTSGFGKLVRIDRLVKRLTSMQEISADADARTSSQSERFCTALPKQVSESSGLSPQAEVEERRSHADRRSENWVRDSGWRSGWFDGVGLGVGEFIADSLLRWQRSERAHSRYLWLVVLR
jgi:hypothetical protein